MPHTCGLKTALLRHSWSNTGCKCLSGEKRVELQMKARLPLPRIGGAIVEHHRFHADNTTRQLAGWTQQLNFASASLLSNFLDSTTDACVCVHTHLEIWHFFLPSSCCITSWCGGSTLPCPGLPPWWLLCNKLQVPDSLLRRPEDDDRASSNNNALYFHACYQTAAWCTLLLLILLRFSCLMSKLSWLKTFKK